MVALAFFGFIVVFGQRIVDALFGAGTNALALTAGQLAQVARRMAALIVEVIDGTLSPLAQGLLTGKYLNGIPEDSRMQREGKKVRGLNEKMLTEANLNSLRLLSEMAQARGQSMAQMALSWLLKDARVTSVLIGASRPEQIEENVRALDNLRFTEDELKRIDQHVADGELNLWQASSDK